MSTPLSTIIILLFLVVPNVQSTGFPTITPTIPLNTTSPVSSSSSSSSSSLDFNLTSPPSSSPPTSPPPPTPGCHPSSCHSFPSVGFYMCLTWECHLCPQCAHTGPPHCLDICHYGGEEWFIKCHMNECGDCPICVNQGWSDCKHWCKVGESFGSSMCFWDHCKGCPGCGGLGDSSDVPSDYPTEGLEVVSDVPSSVSNSSSSDLPPAEVMVEAPSETPSSEVIVEAPSETPSSVSSSMIEPQGCRNWCTTSQLPLIQKCTYHDCIDCGFCSTQQPVTTPSTTSEIPSNIATFTPTASATDDMGCKNWCDNSVLTWSMKCSFVDCHNCASCSTTTSPNIMTTTTSDAPSASLSPSAIVTTLSPSVMVTTLAPSVMVSTDFPTETPVAKYGKSAAPSEIATEFPTAKYGKSAAPSEMATEFPTVVEVYTTSPTEGKETSSPTGVIIDPLTTEIPTASPTELDIDEREEE